MIMKDDLDFLLEEPNQEPNPEPPISKPKEPKDLVGGDQVEIIDDPAYVPWAMGLIGTVLKRSKENISRNYVEVHFDDSRFTDASFYYKHVRHIPK